MTVNRNPISFRVSIYRNGRYPATFSGEQTVALYWGFEDYMYKQNRETIVNVIKQMKRSYIDCSSVASLIGSAAVGLSAVMFLKAVDVRRPQ